MKLSKALLLGAFFGLLPSMVFGGRPLVIDDAMPVGRSEVEIEFGFFHGWPSDGGREQQFPIMTLTYGLIQDLEVGLAIQRVNSDTKGEPPREGFEDLHLNTKYLFLKEGEALPALAFPSTSKCPPPTGARA